MTVLATIWWLFFFSAVGLCLGSFLNVVIFRLPRGLSIRDPVWSFCPACDHRIQWYDNLPVLSFLLLGGRCRYCRAPIALRYPAVEMLTALVVIVLFDTFFVAHTRTGLFNEPYLTWALSQDWPIFFAHLVLFACLLAMAAIDLQEYWVDIRFTAIATWFGLVLHVLWTPTYSLPRPRMPGWPRPADATAIGSMAAMIGLAAVWIWLRTRPVPPDQPPPADLDEANDADETTDPEAPPANEPTESEPPPADTPIEDADNAPAEDLTVATPPSAGAMPVVGTVVVGIVLLGTLISTGLAAEGAPVLPSAWRSLLPAALLFLAILADARTPREADDEVMHAIEAERVSARRMAIEELVLLLPAIALGTAGVFVQLKGGPAAESLAGMLHWQPVGSGSRSTASPQQPLGT